MKVYVIKSAVCDSGEIVLGCFTDKTKANALAVQQQNRREWESVEVNEVELDSEQHLSDKFGDHSGWPTV